MNAVDDAVAQLARAQHGVFSRGQAVRRGATKSMIQGRAASGRWVRVHPAVYRVNGAPVSWHQALMAACLATTGVVSHRTAAALWKLPGFAPAVVEVTVVRGRRRRLPGVTEHEVAALPRVDVTTIGAIPVTTPARTLIDLAAIADKDALEEALDDALRRKLMSASRLRWRAESLGRRPGAATIRALLRSRAPAPEVPQSVFETRLLRALTRAKDIPPPVAQHEVRHHGKLLAVVDFAWPSRKLAVEADGYTWHSGRISWQRDLRRRNALTSAGWRVLHVTWHDVAERADALTDEIRDALSRRSTTQPDRRRRSPSR